MTAPKMIVVSGTLLFTAQWRPCHYEIDETGLIVIRDAENEILLNKKFGEHVECKITAEGRSHSIISNNSFNSLLEVISEGKDTFRCKFPDKENCVCMLSGIARVCAVHNVMELILKMKAQNDFFRFMHSPIESNRDGSKASSNSKETSKTRLKVRRASISEVANVLESKSKPLPVPVTATTGNGGPTQSESRVNLTEEAYKKYKSLSSLFPMANDKIETAENMSIGPTFEVYLCAFYGDTWKSRSLIINEEEMVMESKFRSYDDEKNGKQADSFQIHTVFCRILSEIALSAIAPTTINSELPVIEPENIAVEILMTVPAIPGTPKLTNRIIVLFEDKAEACRFLHFISCVATTHNVNSLFHDADDVFVSPVQTTILPFSGNTGSGRERLGSAIRNGRRRSMSLVIVADELEEAKNQDSEDTSSSDDDVEDEDGLDKPRKNGVASRHGSTAVVSVSPLARRPSMRLNQGQAGLATPGLSRLSVSTSIDDDLEDVRPRRNSISTENLRGRRFSDHTGRSRSITRGSFSGKEDFSRMASDPERRRASSTIGASTGNTSLPVTDNKKPFWESPIDSDSAVQTLLSEEDGGSGVHSVREAVSNSAIELIEDIDSVQVDQTGVLSYKNINAMTFDQVDEIVVRLTNAKENIRELSFEGCELTDEAVTEIVESIFTNQTLLVLNLGSNFCGEDGSLSLANMFLFNNVIIELNLSSNEVGDDGAAAIANVLSVNATLKRLNLSNNDIRGIGAAALAAVLLENSSLEELNLSENSIGLSGTRDFADALLNNSTLLTLDVSHQKRRKVGSDGAMQLARGLRGNTGLKTLRLNSNRILFEGCRFLCGALLVNSTLTELDIGGKNLVTVEGGMQLAQSLAYNTSMTRLYLGNYCLPIKILKGVGHFSPVDISDEENLIRDSQKLDIQALRVSKPAKESMSVVDLQSLDDLATVVGILLQNNNTLEEVRVHGAFVPVQSLNGSDHTATSVDLANIGLMSADAVLVGHLIADNRKLKLISLHGNNFANSEGENSIVNALSKNTGLKIDPVWTADKMFADEYKALASHQGISTAGVLVEPILMDGWLNKSCLVGGCIMYYMAFASDWATFYTFLANPSIYSFNWTVLVCIFINLPSVLISYTAMRAMAKSSKKTWGDAALRLVQIWLQLDYFLETRRSFIAEIEMVTLLEAKFMNAIYRSIPNCLLQLYIVFVVAESTGTFSFIVVLSCGLGLVSMSALFYILFDRADIRLLSFAPTHSNPRIATFISGLFFQDNIKELSNYNAIFNVHFCISVMYHSLELMSRGTCLTWLLAHMIPSYVWAVFLILIVSRLIIIFVLDRRAFQFSFIHNLICALTLCISDSAWRKDFESPWYSQRTGLLMTVWTTLENIGCLCFAVIYPYTYNTSSSISRESAQFIAISMSLTILARLVLLRFWSLPLHYAELYLVRPTTIISAGTLGTGGAMGATNRLGTRRAVARKKNYEAASSSEQELLSAGSPVQKSVEGVHDNISREYGISPPKIAFEMSNEDLLNSTNVTPRKGALSLFPLSPSSSDALMADSKNVTDSSRYSWVGWMEKGGGHSSMLGNFSVYLVTITPSSIEYWRPSPEMVSLLNKEDHKTKLFPTDIMNGKVSQSELRSKGFKKKGMLLHKDIVNASPEMHSTFSSVYYYYLKIDLGERVHHFRTKTAYDRNQFQYQLNQLMNSWMSKTNAMGNQLVST